MGKLISTVLLFRIPEVLPGLPQLRNLKQRTVYIMRKVSLSYTQIWAHGSTARGMKELGL